MSSSFKCPFCNEIFPLTFSTYKSREQNFDKVFSNSPRIGVDHDFKVSETLIEEIETDKLSISFYSCPNEKCKKTTVKIIGISGQFKNSELYFRPTSFAIQFPEYVPLQIRQDYEEACSIIKLSPKASATLLRRCLQGIIRDFFQLSSAKSLADEITEIESLVDPQIKPVLDALRKLGNIGAHPEKDINLIVDIESGEADKLVRFIEYLIEKWYIARFESQKLLDDILNISSQKQEDRKK